MYDGAKHNLFMESGDTPEKVLLEELEWIEDRIQRQST